MILASFSLHIFRVCYCYNLNGGNVWKTVSYKKKDQKGQNHTTINLDAEESFRPNKPQKTKPSKPEAGTSKATNGNNQQRSRRHTKNDNHTGELNVNETPTKTTTVIMGDSVIAKLDGWKMADKKNRVIINAFPGATVEDMADHIKPTLAKKPDNIIIHTGTNDLRSDSPHDVVCMYDGAKLWNKLPRAMRLQSKLSTFKQELSSIEP